MKNRILSIALAIGMLPIGWLSSQPVFALSTTTNSITQIGISASLFNNQNQTIENGSYEIRFALYSKDREVIDTYPSNTDSGVRLWEETQTVNVKSGLIKAFLGSVVSFPDTLNFQTGDYYVGIRIGTDSEMVPRKKLGSVPGAINSQYLQGKTIGAGAGNIPVLGTDGKIDVKNLPTGIKSNQLVLLDKSGKVGIKNLPTGVGSNQLVLGNDSRLLNADANAHTQNTDTGTTEETFTIGSSTAILGNNFDIRVSNSSVFPTLRYNGTTQTWQLSNDGTNFSDISSNASGGFLPFIGGTMIGTISFASGQTFGGSTLTELGYLSGVTSNIQTQFTGKANAAHTHNMSDITSGILSVAQGGTGAGTLANLITLGTDTTGNYVATITAGNGITGSSSSESGTPTISVGLLSTADSVGVNYSFSGLEFSGASSHQLGLIQGCLDRQVLKWDESLGVWACANDAGGSTAVVNIMEGGTSYVGMDTLIFAANDFSVSALSTQATVVIDYLNAQSASASTKGFLTSTDWNTFNDKLTRNVSITGATKTKITYDANGLVTSGADATTADIASSLDKRYVSDAQLVVIGNTSNTNTGDETLATIKTKLGITTLSGSNTGDQTITLTGDITGSGIGSFATTLATVNTNIGTWNNVTVNGKGLVTAASNVAYLTSFTEADTLATVTGRGATTATNASFTGGATIRGLIVDNATVTQDRINITVASVGANRFDGTITNADVTADRTWTLPDTTGTLITTGDTGTVTNTMLAGSIAASKLVGSDIATVGTITTGTWNATVIADGKIAATLTGKTYNDLTLAAAADGFTIAGGSTPRTLTVTGGNASISGTHTGTSSGINTGDETLATIKTKLGITTLSGSNTGDQTITLTGDITGSGTGSFATTLATVNSNIGIFNNVTVNGKGLVTSASNVAYLTSFTEADTLASVTGRGSISNGQTIQVGPSATYDPIIISAIAKGTTSYTGTITSADLTSTNRTWTLPDTTGTLITTGDTGTVTNTMLAGSIAASKLVGSDIATVGTITTGTWNATVIAVGKGGTGQSSYTDGQLLIGNTTGNTLTKATLTGTASQVIVTNGSGSITLSLPQSIATTSTPTFGSTTINGTMSILEGGISPSFHTIFQGGNQSADITYTLPVALGGAGEVLKTDVSGNLYWAIVAGGSGGIGTVTSVASGNGLTGGPVTTSGTLSINLLTSVDGTGSVSSNSGLEFQGTSNDQLTLIQGCASNEVLAWDETNSLWRCASVSGVGGVTGSGTSNSVAYFTGTSSLSSEAQLSPIRGGTGLNTSALTGVPSISGGTWTVTSSLGVALGGTGVGTFTANGILYGNTTGAIQVTAAGTDAQFLVSNAGVPTFVSMSSDVTISNTGVATISANSVALTTDTTGNYVATITAGNGISGSSSTEGGTPTIALGALTADWNQTGAFDISLNNASSELKIMESSGATYYGIFDVTDLSADRTYTFPNATGTVITTGDTGTVTNTMLTGNIDNTKLSNSTISGVSLGGTLATLTIGTGLSGTSYNGSGSITIASTITQYTDALARGAVSLTTSGTSGAATYNSTTGEFNIPQYQAAGSYLTGTKVDSFNTRTGAVTLTSGDVTDALAFIPYNATNPAGYTTNIGTVTSVATGSGLSGGPITTTGTVSLGALTADWNQTGAFDISLNNASSELKIMESSGATYYGIFDVTDLASNRTYTFPDETGTVCTTGSICTGYQSAITNPITGTGTDTYNAYFTGAGTLGAEQYVAVSRGGTNASSVGSAGSIAYSTSTAYAFSAAGTSGQVLFSGGTGTPTWGTVGSGSVTADSLDFTELKDALTLDVSTDIALGALTFSTSGTGAVSFNNTGLLTVAGNIDFNGTANDIAGTLNLSGGALTSTGALTITPQADSGLNVVLSTTGDFAVNTNQLYVDTSTGNVGIGTTVPASMLSVGSTSQFQVSSTGAVTAVGVNSGTGLIQGTGGLTITGNTTLSGSQILGGSPFVFEGATDNNITTTFAFVDPAGSDKTITFPDETGTVCTTGSICTGYQSAITNPITGTGTDTYNAYFTGAGTLGAEQYVAVSRGGTNASSVGGAGSIAYSTGTAYAFSAVGTSGQVLLSGASGSPTWGLIGSAGITTDSLDFTEFQDSMTLDASTDIALNSFNFSFSGTGNVGIGTTDPASMFSVGATSQFQVSSTGAVTAVGINSGAGLIQGTGGLTITGNITVSGSQILGASPMVFEGATDNDITTTFAFVDPTVSNKTITFPDETGTVCTTGSICTGYQSTITNPVTGTGNTNEIAYFTGASAVGSLAVATYPSLTELSYVKGVTSGIQAQLNGKQASLGFTPYDATNPSGYTSNTGTVTSVGGTGTVSGLTLTGTVTTSGNLTLGGTLSLSSGNVTTALGFTPYDATNPSGYIAYSSVISGFVTGANSTVLNTDSLEVSIEKLQGQMDNKQASLGFTPYNATNPNGYTTNVGTVTSVSGTGTVSGLTLTGTVSTTGNLTLGGTLSLSSGNVTTALGFTPYDATNPSGYITSAGTAANITGLTATAAELNILAGVTGVTAAELSYVGDVTSAIQTQLNGKQASLGFTPYNATNPSGYITSAGTAANITGLTATAAELNILGGVTGVTAAELSYVGDVTGLIQAQLNLKSPLDSPTFTNIPAAPTAAAGTNTTQLATTAFVTTADNLKANLASPTFTGTVVVGDINFTGKLKEDGVEILSGVIAAFSGACPTGWTEYTAARGRYIVGTPSGGTNAGTVGTALTDQENRPTGQHNHTLIMDQGTAGTTIGLSGTSGDGHADSSLINSSGSVAGTNAPYIQLTYCQKTAGSDVAEWIPASENISAGAIVSVDPNNREKVIASRKEYDPTVVGIVSTQPGWLLGNEGEGQVQMALAGRVPIKVTLKNGNIEPGDLITTSAIPGVGMRANKAGPIVGKAMEAVNESSSLTACTDPITGKEEKCGTVLVFINISWYEPQGEVLTVNENGEAFFSGNVGIGETVPGSKLSVLGGMSIGDATYSTVASPAGGAIIQGNVGIGTTNPTNFKLQVAGSVGPDATNSYNLGAAGSNWGCLYYNSGTLGTCASDVRLKNNIADLSFGSDPLGQIAGLKPRTFSYKSDASDSLYSGLIAQEVEQVAPELVTTDVNGYKAVKYGDIQWLTLSALQQLNKNVIAKNIQNDTIIADLNLKTDTNIITLAELQASVDTQLSVVGTELTALAAKNTQYDTYFTNDLAHLKSLDTLTSKLALDMNTQASRITTLEDQMTALMTFYTNATLGNILTKDAEGNIDLTVDSKGLPVLMGGKLKATILETGGLVIDVINPLAPTIGTAEILPVAIDANADGNDDYTSLPMKDPAVIARDGKSVEVMTEAMIPMIHGSRIFTNFKDNPNAFSWIEKIQDDKKDYVGFRIHLSVPVLAPVKTDWLLVEQK